MALLFLMVRPAGITHPECDAVLWPDSGNIFDRRPIVTWNLKKPQSTRLACRTEIQRESLRWAAVDPFHLDSSTMVTPQLCAPPPGD